MFLVELVGFSGTYGGLVELDDVSVELDDALVELMVFQWNLMMLWWNLCCFGGTRVFRWVLSVDGGFSFSCFD